MATSGRLCTQTVADGPRDKAHVIGGDKRPLDSGYFNHTHASSVYSTQSEQQQDLGIGNSLEVKLYFSRCLQDTPIYKKKNFEETWNITAFPGDEKCVSSFSDELESPKSRSIIISGVPGAGKTSLVNDIVNRWHSSESLHSFEHIMVIFSKCENDRIGRQEQRETIPQHELNSSGKSWLFIFHQCGTDFIDKLPSGSLVKGILAGQVLHEATLLFICMPSEVEQIGSLVKIDCCYTLHGFTLTGLERYLQTHSNYSSEILSYLQCNQLTNLCSNPLVCTKIVQIFQGRRFEEPKTLTDFLCKLVSALVFHHLDPEEKASIGSSSQLSLECLPEPAAAAFDGACLLAYEHMLYGHKCANRDESQHFLSTFCLKLPGISLNEICRFGLVNAFAHSGYVYEFLDPIINEFLTAFYFYKQLPLNQVTLLYHKTLFFLSTNYKLWIQIFFGLVGDDYSKHTSLFNPTKLMLNTVIDVLVHSLELNYEAEYRYTLIKCIIENQETSLLRKLASKHPAVLSFSVSVNELNKSIKPVSTLINKSGCSEWTVSTCSANRWVVDKIKESTTSSCSMTIAVNLDHGSSEVVYFSPQRSALAVQKMYRDGDSSLRNLSKEEKVEKLNLFCCRAVKEILQRVLTLYSPVKIKGDASNVSYVSFLTCACFKDSFLAHIELFPLQPIHFLPGPKKDLARLPRESLTPTDRHNLEKHNGESMEVVIMLRPIIQKLEGVVPVTNERFSLLFSHGPLNLSPESSSGRDVSVLVSIERCLDKYQINGSCTEQTLSSLPVVQKTIYGRSQTAYPKPLLPPVQAPRAEPKAVLPTIGEEERKDVEIDSRGNSNSTSLNPVVMTQLEVDSQVPVASSQGLVSKHSKIRLSQAHAIVHNFAKQVVGKAQVHQAATSRRQTALRPGTVLFTSMPEKIPSDRIQPLPLQHSLIRKGGNGSIFSENLAGTAFAVKKTSYRSKEYAILTKIHHKNILPLLAYVWGEEHAESRRRYYVYHYLPKLSGDLARLVTDKEKLSLYEFHKEHQYTDLKAMGAALGNIKYILSQVL